MLFCNTVITDNKEVTTTNNSPNITLCVVIRSACKWRSFKLSTSSSDSLSDLLVCQCD